VSAFNVGDRVKVIKDNYVGNADYYDDHTGLAGYIVAIDPEWINPYEVKLDGKGFSECFAAEEIEAES
jgi:hypothetical protein